MNVSREGHLEATILHELVDGLGRAVVLHVTIAITAGCADLESLVHVRQLTGTIRIEVVSVPPVPEL